LTHIVRDPDLRPRGAVDRTIVYKYADALREGATFPPILLLDVEGALLLVDGWIRVEAYQLSGRKQIAAEVLKGTKRDALCHALEFNALHGNFTRGDMRRAVEIYLQDPEMGQWPDRRIARRLGISPSTVGNHRARLDRLANASKPAVEVGQQIVAYREALAKLAEAEGTDRVQIEIGKWWAAVSNGGTVKWRHPNGGETQPFGNPC
jgi:hypothetical protein